MWHVVVAVKHSTAAAADGALIARTEGRGGTELLQVVALVSARHSTVVRSPLALVFFLRSGAAASGDAFSYTSAAGLHGLAGRPKCSVTVSSTEWAAPARTALAVGAWGKCTFTQQPIPNIQRIDTRDIIIAAHRAFVSGCEGPRHRGIV
jgi:hypothetical protein